ncbi:hypothetical protein AGMMS49938_17020 [Fibrobacterales bacterium]|nr:hypothetical protein AGMMS49938_17020 [Fibrobacterales bacterium]
MKKVLVLFFVIASSVIARTEGSLQPDNLYSTFNLTLNIASWGAPTASQFAADTMENFGGKNGNWRALRVPLETARQFETLPPFFALNLGAGYGNTFVINAEFPLRRDIEAWYNDGYKTTFTLKPSELDLNVPTDAWAQWNNPAGFVKFGRFKPELSPTPNTIMLGGVPYHDAIYWNFNAGIAKYDFLIISLNSWLDSTEIAQQQTTTIPNQRGRIYTDPTKNLLIHRVGIKSDWGFLSIAEQSLIGGKNLEFRDFSPFAAWHNNFSYGYSKMSTVFEAGLSPGKMSDFYWQFVIEDLQSPVGEVEGDKGYTTFAFLAGYKQKIPLGKFGNLGDLESRLDIVRTDPQYNNNKVPLQKMTSRKIYNSNYREQGKPNFADMYIVDYPLGYRRGPDALDLWWNLKYVSPNKKISAELETAFLRQGDCELYSDHQECSERNLLGGVEEKIFLMDFSGQFIFNTYFSIFSGAGFQIAQNKDHIDGYNKTDAWFRGGLRVRL